MQLLDLPTYLKSDVICECSLDGLTQELKLGVSSPGVPGMPRHPQILADTLTLSQPRGADYAQQIILAPPDIETFLRSCNRELNQELTREFTQELASKMFWN